MDRGDKENKTFHLRFIREPPRLFHLVLRWGEERFEKRAQL